MNKYKWGWIFTDIEEIESDIFADVTISLGRFEIDPENFDEESFIEHLIEEASEKIKETDYSTVLQKMEVI